MRYHTYLCPCCHTSANGGRNFARDLEPSASFKFDSSYEKELTSIAKARGELSERVPFVCGNECYFNSLKNKFTRAVEIASPLSRFLRKLHNPPTICPSLSLCSPTAPLHLPRSPSPPSTIY